MSAPSSPDAARGLTLIALAAVSWGTTGSVTTVLVARAGATPLVIGAVRMIVAAALLVAAARVLAGGRGVSPGDRWRCLAAGVCNAGFQAAYFTSVTLTGIAIAALIAICSAPILIAALAAVMLGERRTRRLAASLALGVSGTALLIVGPRAAGRAPPQFATGVALAVTAGLAYALYVVVAKATVGHTAPLPAAAWMLATAAVVMAPALLENGAARQIQLALALAALPRRGDDGGRGGAARAADGDAARRRPLRRAAGDGRLGRRRPPARSAPAGRAARARWRYARVTVSSRRWAGSRPG